MARKGKTKAQNSRENSEANAVGGRTIDKPALIEALLRSLARPGQTEKKKERIRTRLNGLGHTVGIN